MRKPFSSNAVGKRGFFPFFARATVNHVERRCLWLAV